MYATVDIAFPKELAEYNNGGTADFSTSSLDCLVLTVRDAPKTIAGLLDAHRRICAQVLPRKITLTGKDNKPEPLTVDARADNPYEDHENYKLEPIFFAIFIVMDTIPSLNACHHRIFSNRDFISVTTVLLVRTANIMM